MPRAPKGSAARSSAPGGSFSPSGSAEITDFSAAASKPKPPRSKASLRAATELEETMKAAAAELDACNADFDAAMKVQCGIAVLLNESPNGFGLKLLDLLGSTLQGMIFRCE